MRRIALLPFGLVLAVPLAACLSSTGPGQGDCEPDLGGEASLHGSSSDEKLVVTCAWLDQDTVFISGSGDFSLDMQVTKPDVPFDSSGDTFDDRLSLELIYPDDSSFDGSDANFFRWRVGAGGYEGVVSLPDAPDPGLHVFLGSDELVEYSCTGDEFICRESAEPAYRFDAEFREEQCQANLGTFAEGPCDRDLAVGECIRDGSPRVIMEGICEQLAMTGDELSDQCAPNLGETFVELNGGCP